MRLHSLLSALDRQAVFRDLVEALRARGARREVLSAITPARPYALAALHAALDRPMLLVVGRPTAAYRAVGRRDRHDSPVRSGDATFDRPARRRISRSGP